MARTDVPFVRVNYGTLAVIAADSKLSLNIQANSLPANQKDRLGRKGRGITGSLRGTITDIFLELHSTTLTSTECTAAGALDFVFYGKDSNTSWLLGEESFLAADIIRVPNGGNTAIGHLGGLSIPYQDLDNSGEWHIVINNSHSTNTLTTGIATFAFNFKPEYPA